MDLIYLDNNASTPLLPAAWEAMRPFLTEAHGNPASAHSAGRRARRALEDSREKVASLLGAHPDEVILTSGATEANNLALFGLCGQPPARLLSSPVEHPSVSEPLQQLARAGFTLDLLPVDRQGVVPLGALDDLLRPETRLVSVMLANNETGAIQPVRELARRLEGRAVFHCDAAQAVGKMPVDFHDLGVTSLSLSAHKFHGPQGVGALLVRRGAKLAPRTWGGHQQRGLRPGTEPVALAVGLAVALEQAVGEMDRRQAHVLALRERLLGQLRTHASPVVLNGPEEGGIPHALNLSFPGLRGDVLLMSLDLAGVACSTGSACSSGSLLPSPVLRAMGVHKDVLRSAMRFSLSPLLSAEEVDEAARRIARVVNRLRAQPASASEECAPVPAPPSGQ
jgi:cysteine desulfurase